MRACTAAVGAADSAKLSDGSDRLSSGWDEGLYVVPDMRIETPAWRTDARLHTQTTQAKDTHPHIHSLFHSRTHTTHAMRQVTCNMEAYIHTEAESETQNALVCAREQGRNAWEDTAALPTGGACMEPESHGSG